MTNEERKQQQQRIAEVDALRRKVGIAIVVAETAEQQAYRVARQYTTLGSLKVRDNLERALNA
tara:strand:- start:1147 stop:1335 length:189 start_codon:yes stop_codon:yes gene_type:complete